MTDVQEILPGRKKHRVSPTVIKLNVGGKYFDTTYETASKSPVLKIMIDNEHGMTLYDNNRIFIDRDPQLFVIVLNCLREYMFEVGTFIVLGGLCNSAPRINRLVMYELKYFDVDIGAVRLYSNKGDYIYKSLLGRLLEAHVNGYNKALICAECYDFTQCEYYIITPKQLIDNIDSMINNDLIECIASLSPPFFHKVNVVGETYHTYLCEECYKKYS
jgi:hypothetical protein